jgi:hypothetical protein
MAPDRDNIISYKHEKSQGGIMRTGIFIILLILTGCMLFAQAKSIKAGDLMIGGSLNGGIETGTKGSLDSDGNEILGTKFNEFRAGIGLEAGYFIVNNLEIGPILNFELTSESYSSDVTDHYDTRTIGLGLQLGFFLDMSGMLAGYFKMAGTYNMFSGQSFLNGNPGTETTESGFSIEPEAGLAIFLNGNGAVLIGGFFSYDTMKNKTTENSELNIRYGLKLSASMFL